VHTRGEKVEGESMLVRKGKEKETTSSIKEAVVIRVSLPDKKQTDLVILFC